MELEAWSDWRIENHIRLILAQIELVDEYLSGKLKVEDDPAPQPPGVAGCAPEDVKLEADQMEIIISIDRMVEKALKQRWPDEASPEAWENWASSAANEEKDAFAMSVLGPAGSGKHGNQECNP